MILVVSERYFFEIFDCWKYVCVEECKSGVPIFKFEIYLVRSTNTYGYFWHGNDAVLADIHQSLRTLKFFHANQMVFPNSIERLLHNILPDHSTFRLLQNQSILLLNSRNILEAYHKNLGALIIFTCLRFSEKLITNSELLIGLNFLHVPS